MAMPTPPISDDQLVRYLLGALPPDETERLDEQTFVDEELAERVRVVEDDLVDSYAAGTLSGDRLQRFESFYLASPRRRSKAAFAKGLHGAIDRSTRQPRPVPAAEPQVSRPVGRALWWPLAAAAALIVATAVLLLQNITLRRELRDSERQVAVADQRATAASEQLSVAQKAATAAKQALADARAAPPLAAVALVLLPQTRGVTSVPILVVPTGAAAVPLTLALETGGGASFEVALRDPATNGTIWRSPSLARQRVRQTPMVPVSLPAALLKAQHYALDLFERRSGSGPEFVNSYAFEVARQ
jgi:hypothetical protein